MDRAEFAAFITKAMEFHPCNAKYQDSFTRMKASVNAKEYV